MTYLQYHLVFIVPVLLVLTLFTWRQTRGGRSPAGAFRPEPHWAWRTFLLFPLIPLLYTTPWDNYLVYKQVWNYPPERVLGRLGYVPIEEYAFFILQTLITGLWLYFLLRRHNAPERGAQVSVSPLLTRWGQSALWLGVAFAGVVMLRFEATFYLGLILSWAAPVLSGLSAFGGDLVLGRPRTFWWAVLPPTLYLWATDFFAIGQGIWSISPRFTLGWNLGGVLPIEEMTFFLITNLLIVTGLLAFLHPVALARVQVLRRVFQPWQGFVLLYALLKIPVPLWPQGFALLGTLSTAALFLAALSWAWQQVGVRALGPALLAFGVGLGVEVLGSRTGFPFGHYSYAGAPGLTLLGVPLLVPLGWFAMTLAAGVLTRGRAWLAGLLLVAWDVGLEPLMTAQGFWQWQDPGALWAGAPIQNFVGWWAVGSGLVWAVQRLTPQLFDRPAPPTTSFAAAYLIEAAFLSAGLLLLGLPGAALLTAAAMGLMIALTLRQRPAPRQAAPSK
ncbi:carotenoid biosynthesis protein [Deinococcus irradiatisoli]|uniref:Carotenoid biosynthesis protein n=1 Tax=Deinococcus irradiatisoli TaxID=2202254 RepID=A0A2Z3JGM5_9DEIO|nr:carotenoid biosynthesis protein [Deinococcus irradiatisoli]AWN24145.1 carotenoid biosynthesis protein [Deinococcus irradiatisoli]